VQKVIYIYLPDRVFCIDRIIHTQTSLTATFAMSIQLIASTYISSCRSYPWSSGCTNHHVHITLWIKDDRRTHGRLRSLSRLHTVSRSSRWWKEEIVHLVVEQNSSSFADPLWPETTQNPTQETEVRWALHVTMKYCKTLNFRVHLIFADRL